MAPKDKAIAGPSSSTMTGPEGSKMRLSCQACAGSKVACNKVRPTCVRCEKRGVECVYVETKRAGRPMKSRSQHSYTTSSDTGADATGSRLTQTSSIASSCSSAQKPSKEWISDPIAVSGSPNIFANTPLSSVVGHGHDTTDISFSPDYSGILETLNYHGAYDFDALPMLMDASGTQSKGTNMSIAAGEQGVTYGDHAGADVYALMENGLESLTSPATRTYASSTDFGTPSEAAAVHMTAVVPDKAIADANSSAMALTSTFAHHEHSLRGCMTRCLGFLDELTPHGMTDTPGGDCVTDVRVSKPLTASFESVINQTGAAVDAVTEMLQCVCSRNPVLLFNLALVLLRILEWYDACIGASGQAYRHDGQPGQSSAPHPADRSFVVRQPSRLTMQEYDVEVDECGNIACQVILSRLHTISSISKLLARKLSEVHTDDNPAAVSASSASTTSSELGNMPLSASSHAALTQSLASTLHRCLTELGRKCIGKLSEP